MFNLAPAIPARSDLDWCWYLRRQGKSGEVLERVLHDIGVMDPGGWAPWGRSTLTATGAPVEMVFSAGQTDLQLVTEVADPSRDPVNRMAEVCKIMQGLGARQPSPGLRDVISAAQTAGPLAFGARLGLRHGSRGLQCQLIAELPSAAADLSKLMCSADFDPLMDSLGDTTRPTMVSFDGLTGDVTVHFEMQDATRDRLPALATPAQVSPDILSLSIDGMMDSPGQTPLPVRQLGFSYTMRDDDQPPVLTLYMSAAELFGADAVIAERIRNCGGYQLTGYTALVDNLPPALAPHTHHGRIGMTARQGSAPLLSIGVAAPWTCIFA